MPVDVNTYQLPSEIWTRIFDLAADEGIIFNHDLPTVMAECVWFKTIFGQWQLRTAQESINLIQRRSYATKKVGVFLSKSLLRLTSLGNHIHLQKMASTWLRIPFSLSLL